PRSVRRDQGLRLRSARAGPRRARVLYGDHHRLPGRMKVARLRLASVRETMFPSRAPFFRDRLGPRAAEIAAWTEENERGNLRVSPYAPSTAHRQKIGR